MLRKVFAIVIAIAFLPALANAGTKVAEYGDPQIGNDFNNCTFEIVYGTGGGGYYAPRWLYNEYEISCPSEGTFEVGVYEQESSYSFGSPECTFYPDDGYYVIGNCENWRVYLDD